MEPEIQNIEPKQTHPVFKVTTFSKYFAMTLFILMPFVGGLIGYVYAPEKGVEIRNVVVEDRQDKDKSVTVNQIADPHIRLSNWNLQETLSIVVGKWSEKRLSLTFGYYGLIKDGEDSDLKLRYKQLTFNEGSGEVRNVETNSTLIKLYSLPPDFSEITLREIAVNSTSGNSAIPDERKDWCVLEKTVAEYGVDYYMLNYTGLDREDIAPVGCSIKRYTVVENLLVEVVERPQGMGEIAIVPNLIRLE